MREILTTVPLSLVACSLTLYSVQTRVPLLIASPQSPFPGQHYPHIVEHIDVLPTIIDLLQLPEKRECTQHFFKGVQTLCLPFAGKSLAPVMLGGSKQEAMAKNQGQSPADPQFVGDITFPSRQFAIQQKLSCLQKGHRVWIPCMPSPRFKAKVNLAVSGYSLRDAKFRYTLWLPFNITLWSLSLNESIFFEELYDHRGEALKDYGHLETQNVIKSSLFHKEVLFYRTFLMDFIHRNISFVSESTKKNILAVIS